jgi:uncharacterized membrane protein
MTTLFNVVSVTLLAVVGGMYWGPWLALTRTIDTFDPATFLLVVQRLSRNMATLMTVLVPIALASMIPVMVVTFAHHRTSFWLTVAAFVLFVVTLVVTMAVEVPIVLKIVTWTPATLPHDWADQRDRWRAFHLWRVIPALTGLAVMVIGVAR